MDRRTMAFSGRVAHVSMLGVINAPMTEGEAAQVVLPLVDLRQARDGGRDRQLLMGDVVTVIDREQDHAFVLSAKDGYCGWVREAALSLIHI